MGENLATTVEDDIVGYEVESQLGEQRLIPHASVADTAPLEGVALEITPAVGETGVNTDAKYFKLVGTSVVLHALKFSEHRLAVIVP